MEASGYLACRNYVLETAAWHMTTAFWKEWPDVQGYGLLDSPTVDSRHEANFLCGLMCAINLVNSRPMEQALKTVAAQIRPYIRERWRADLFQSLLIALSNSPSLSRAPTAPLFLSTLDLLIPLHGPEESSLCAGAGSLTEAERWIWLRVTWFCLSVWPGRCPNTEARLSCLSVFRVGTRPPPPVIFLLCCYADWSTYMPWARLEFVHTSDLSY